MVCDNKIEKAETRPVDRQDCACQYSPLVDIIETQEKYLLIADIPGANAENVDIAYERGTLTLSARVQNRDPQSAHFVFREFGVGDYRRTFQIGEGIDASRIEAEVANGVLTLHLPKTEIARTRKIAVKAG